ncbi:hypothetical protein [Burkholderia gladioli]|uniref:hypothetical protein n=1 Tax=Burkholderia gladioli TaxID=28095 RepID=UPI00164209D3|nr:hypothetical protein [Burkholderia gladioli]
MTPPKNKLKNLAEVLRTALPPVQSGAVCVIVRDATLMLHARMTFQSHILSAASIADVSIAPIETLTALYGSGSHDADIAEVLVHHNGNASHRIDELKITRLDNCRVFKPLSNEGVHVTLQNLKDYGCIAAEQNIVGMPRDEMIDAINRLDAGSQKQNGIVLLFLLCSANNDATWLRQHCDEVFIVDKCEPGPGASIAYSITALSLESQHANGIGRTMCEISYQGSDWSSTSSVFIAAKAEDRAIWFARREGEYLETIAGWMGVDKSTVKRRQANLPLSLDIDADVDPPDGWHDQWFPFLGWNDSDDDDAVEDESSDRPRRIG